MEALDKFYEVSVRFDVEDQKGKIKKEVKKYLVDAKDTADAQKNTIKLLDGTMFDWEIISISISKISEVFVNND